MHQERQDGGPSQAVDSRVQSTRVLALIGGGRMEELVGRGWEGGGRKGYGGASEGQRRADVTR